MQNIRSKVINTLIHLPLDGGVHPAFGMVCGILGLFQLIAAITDSQAQLHQATSWSDPNVYISTPFAVIEGSILTLTYVAVLFVRVFLAENGDNISRPGMNLRYLGVVLVYLRTVCETVVLGPFLIGCLKTFLEPTDQIMLGMAITGMIIYFGVVYPVAMYCSIDTTLLTVNGDRKFSLFNAELLLNIYKIIMVATSVLAQSVMVFLTLLFFLLYLMAVLKRPYYCYAGQEFKRATVSIVAFVCISRTFNAIFGRPEGLILLELLGMVSFIFLV